MTGYGGGVDTIYSFGSAKPGIMVIAGDNPQGV